jgi:uncharacterized RDD family membrane protein YckC
MNGLNKNFIYASYTKRFLSNITDLIIILLSILLIYFILDCTNYNLLNKIKPYGDYIFIFIFVIFYHSYFVLTKWQATPGKRLFNIQVVNNNGGKVNFKHSLIRTAMGLFFYICFISIFTFPLLFIEKFAKSLGYFNGGYMRSLLYTSWPLIYLFIDLSLMYGFFRIFNKQQTIYDRFTKTHVIVKQ